MAQLRKSIKTRLKDQQQITILGAIGPIENVNTFTVVCRTEGKLLYLELNYEEATHLAKQLLQELNKHLSTQIISQ